MALQQRSLQLAAPLAAFSLALAACSGISDPGPPTGAVPLSPPAVYAMWWRMTEACSGLTGSMQNVKWYEASSLDQLDGRGESTLGYWSREGNRIVLASSVVMNPRVVRHEMLHALVQGSGHPRRQFVEKCGGTVVCTNECVDQAGPAPPIASDIPRIQPDAMVVSATITPAEPNSSLHNAYFGLEVRVRNPASHSVVVALPGSEPGSAPVSFSYQLSGGGQIFDTESSSVRALDSSVTSFAAGETKLHVFDFFIAGDFFLVGKVPTGQFQVTAAFGGHSAPTLLFTVR